jgi:hypothetical protein
MVERLDLKMHGERVGAEPRTSGKKPSADVERTADAWPGNLAHEPDAAPGITQ